MAGEANHEFRLKKNDDRRNSFSEEIKHNDSMIEKYEKTCKFFKYVEQLLILASVTQIYLNKTWIQVLGITDRYKFLIRI